MIKAGVSLKNLDGFQDALEEIRRVVDQNLDQVARLVETEAKASAAFADKTGKLRRSIRKRKSRFEDGGYIVAARAPHAHLIEFGHVMIAWGRPTGRRVPPHPFLRPAVERGILKAMVEFR